MYLVRHLAPLLFLLEACTTAPGPTTQLATPPPTVDIEQTASFRTGCAADVLLDFVDAFDRGDASRLATFFSATEGSHGFEWFVTAETPPYGPLLSELADRFATWHAAHERWRVVSVKSGVGPSWHGGVDFEMTIERSWPDRSVTETGKGALDCKARKIFVFVLGAPMKP